MQAQQRAYLDTVRGLTLPISAKVAPNALKANFLVAAPQGTRAHAQTWAYMNPYTVTIGFVVRKDKVNPNEVQKWSDLANSKFSHSIVFDQIYSTTAFALARAMGVNPANNPPSSLDPVWNRIKSLRPNLASLGNGADVTTALTNGTATIGVTCTCNAVAAIKSGTPLQLVAPRDGGYEVADSYYIHKNIPPANYYYAELFANYLYTNATQSFLASDQALVPTVASASIPGYMKAQPLLFPRTAAQVKAAKMVVAPISLMARYDAPWQSAFEAAIK
jgi:spermidine/putrescine-binding protein